jgi:hypothetical protein
MISIDEFEDKQEAVWLWNYIFQEEARKKMLSALRETKSFLEGFITYGIAPPEQIIPLVNRLEQMDGKFEYIFTTLDYISALPGTDDQGMISAYDIRKLITTGQDLLPILQRVDVRQEIFQIADVMKTASHISEYWCKKHQLNIRFDFNYYFRICSDYLSSGFGKIIECLEIWLKWLRGEELMNYKPSNNPNAVYPYTHARGSAGQGESEENRMRTVYDSPELR